MTEEYAPSDWLPSNARPPRVEKPRHKAFVSNQDATRVGQREFQWEYKTQRVPPRVQRRAHEKALNKMALKGWELVDVRFGGLLRSTDIATFRRPRK